MIHLRLNESEIACGFANATSVNSSIDHDKVTCPKCRHAIHWGSDSESFTTACGFRALDFITGKVVLNVARDYHKVTCKMCERWLRENMVNDDVGEQQDNTTIVRDTLESGTHRLYRGGALCGKVGDCLMLSMDDADVTCKKCLLVLSQHLRDDGGEKWIKGQQVNQAFASDEAQEMLLEDVTGDFERDKRRWELAKELYLFALTKLKIVAGHRRDVEAYASGAVMSADVLLDAFEKRDKEAK